MSVDPASLRRAALQTAQEILSLQRKADAEIRELNLELRSRSEALTVANTELQHQTELARANARDAELFQIAFHASASGILLVTPELRVLRVNPALCEFLGWTAADLAEARLDALLLAEDVPPVRAGIERLLRGEETRALGEAQFRHSSGRAAWGSLSIAVVRERDGGHHYLVVEVQDITARKAAEAEQRRLEEQFLQAQKMEALGTLAGGVAHDFNNILAAIVSNAELVQHLCGDAPDVAEAAREIVGAADRGADLVRQILAFSRRSDGRRAPLRLGAIVQQALRMLRAALPAAIELRLELCDDEVVVEADPTQIQQVVTNLATNAWHAMEGREGRLQVRLRRLAVDAATAAAVPNLREGPYASLAVEDDGHGMDEETLRHAFEPFFTTKPPGKGTGLGLSVVYGIVRAHDGAIEVASAPGQGTRVEVFFPAFAGREAAPPSSVAAPHPGQGERILVVDDEPGLVQVITRLLCKLGYAARGLSSPEAALELCGSEAFELVLVDYNMPVMNGVELVRRLREQLPALPVVMMSGYAAPVDPGELERLGVREVLSKPVSWRVLADAVRAALTPAASV